MRKAVRGSVFGALLALAVFAIAPATSNAAVVRSGTLEVAHSDGFAQGKSTTEYALSSGGKVDLLAPTAVLRGLRDGTRVTLRGNRAGSRITPISATPQAAPRAVRAASATGNRRTAVVLVRFADADLPIGVSDARSAVYGTASDFLAEQSNGQVHLTGAADPNGDIFGPYTVNKVNPTAPDVGCQPDYWSDQATAAAAAQHGSLGVYEHVIFVLPYRSSCGWAGRAEVSALNASGHRVWMNGTLALRVLGHELGHNLGLPHAATMACSSGGRQVSIGGTCTMSEYGDPFDVMGAGVRHYGGWGKGRIAQRGIFPSLPTQTVTAAGTYTLNPSVLGAPGTEAIRIPRPGTPYSLFLEVRKPLGQFDAVTDASTTGVSVRLARSYDDPYTQSGVGPEWTKLLDATPETRTFEDAPIALGRIFYDPSDGLAVTNLSVDPLTHVASVKVEFGAPPPPLAPKRLLARANRRYGVKLRWPRVRGASDYNVYRDGVPIGTIATGKFYDPAVVPGTMYGYAVTAMVAGKESPRTEPVFVMAQS